MARRYRTPFLQIIYNNRGWKAPRFSALAVHPDGFASRAEDLDLSFDPPPDYSGIAAAAGGAFARMVKRPQEVEAAIAEGLRVVLEEQPLRGARRVALASLIGGPIRSVRSWLSPRPPAKVPEASPSSRPPCFGARSRGPRSGEHHARACSFMCRPAGNGIFRLRAGPDAARRLRSSRVAACRQVRQVDL